MIILMLADIVSIQICSFLALLIRFDLNIAKIPPEYSANVLRYWPIHTLLTVALFFLAHLYSTMWSVAGIREVIRIVLSCGLSTVLQIAGMTLLQFFMPRSYYIISFVALCIAVTGIRLSYRIKHSLFPSGNRGGSRIMIVGAGTSGSVILKEMMTSRHTNGTVVCFADDDINKKGKYLNGVPIAGGREEIPELAKQYRVDEIYVAIPSAPAKERKKILEICRETDCKIKMLPGIYQLLNGEVSVAKLREVQIEDLLGRDPIRVNLDEIMGYVQDKVILVTGGGGSIGSELCRQIANYHPESLLILDNYENNAYELQMELKRHYPELDVMVLIVSVQNRQRIHNIFAKYRPEIVFHAAAHKHVPLMENSPCDAIKNNVFGTINVAKEAGAVGAKRMVLISTDKAVRPTNIMGASKRICEMVIQTFNQHSDTEYVAVRFGNVLGSNGSVVPLFRKQIQEGGPVTVTHPEIIRYFMTIPEAVSLVLQAGAYAKGGEIFILDMGEPVKILDLAENMIRLSGLTPGEDIEIKFTGLRPGEKLYEELLIDEDNKKETPNKRIFIGQPIPLDEEKFIEDIRRLETAAFSEDPNIRDIVKELVPEYTINGH